MSEATSSRLSRATCETRVRSNGRWTEHRPSSPRSKVLQGAAPDHPMELFRMKYLAEQELKESGLAWTIIRPTAYMETWAALIGEPLLKSGRTRIFGRGENPINFVSAQDVARFVELAVVDPAMHGEVVEVGGPENLSMNQFAQTFETVSGKV